MTHVWSWRRASEEGGAHKKQGPEERCSQPNWRAIGGRVINTAWRATEAGCRELKLTPVGGYRRPTCERTNRVRTHDLWAGFRAVFGTSGWPPSTGGVVAPCPLPCGRSHELGCRRRALKQLNEPEPEPEPEGWGATDGGWRGTDGGWRGTDGGWRPVCEYGL